MRQLRTERSSLGDDFISKGILFCMIIMTQLYRFLHNDEFSAWGTYRKQCECMVQQLIYIVSQRYVHMLVRHFGHLTTLGSILHFFICTDDDALLHSTLRHTYWCVHKLVFGLEHFLTHLFIWWVLLFRCRKVSSIEVWVLFLCCR